MKNKLYILLAITFIALTFMLGSWGLTESSEGRYAQIAKEMVVNGNYINPTLLGIKHLHKPPATYYITALGYKIFGINEFGARFFMQLALIFQILLVFKITLNLYKNEKLALAAALIYTSFPIVIIAVRTLTTDAYLTTFILASIYFWLQYKEKLKPYYLYLFYIFLGLIFETKGPVGFLVPLTFIITYKIVYKQKIDITIHQFLGFLLFLLVSSAWYIAVINKNEGLFDYFFNNQLVERVSENKFKRGKPFWYYIAIMPLIGLPWLFFIPAYFKKNIKAIWKEKKTAFILSITFLVMFLILSLSTSKLPLYILPLFGVLAIFSANYLSDANNKIIKVLTTIFISLIVALTLALVVLSFLTIDIKIDKIPAFVIFIIFTAITFSVYKKILNTNYLKPAYLGVVFIITLTISSNFIFKQNQLKVNSIKPIAQFIKSNANKNSNVMVYNYLLPSLSFYLDKNITTINHGRYTTQREIQFETNKNWTRNLINYFTEEGRERVLNTSTENKTFLIKRKKDIFPDTLLILQNKLRHKKEFEKFEVYY